MTPLSRQSGKSIKPVWSADAPALTELTDAIEGFLKPVIAQLQMDELDDSSTHGRPRILPALALWAGLLVCVARGFSAQLELWRLLTAQGLWDFPRFSLSDDAIYKRLKQASAQTFETLFEQITQVLRMQQGLQQGLQQAPQSAPVVLAAFAQGVYALDEMTLDAVTKRLPSLRERAGSVLPGKLSTVFDVRAQLWQQVVFQEDATQNEKVAARALLAHVPVGSLLLADLGYFSFAWFDDLTDQGYFWISRLRAKTSYTLLHTLYEDVEDAHEGTAVRDAIVWLGAHRADRAAHAVRLIQISRAGQTWSYLTNVLDPQRLSVCQVGQLYARRWDIEMMFNLVKTHLKLHMLWSSHTTVVLHQVFAVFTIAQIILGLRTDIAQRAQADVFEVSLDLMIRWLPRFARAGLDPIQTLVERGRQARIIRPASRTRLALPDIPLHLYRSPPDTLPLSRTPRYAGKP
jgi:hypothetical protein